MARALKKSRQFPKAFTIPNRKGHYFLNEGRTVDFQGRKMVCVPYLFYTHKWKEDNYYFDTQEYTELVAQL